MSAERTLATLAAPDAARHALRVGTGDGVRIAVLDSGVEADHPAFADITLVDQVGIGGSGMRLRMTEAASDDVFGHGTAVASVIHRHAPRAALGSFRVLGETGRSRSEFIREAAFEALDRRYHILHCSFGCPGDYRQLPMYKQWIDAAYLQGAHVVAAASNDDPHLREWPSHYPTVISVAMAVDGAASLSVTSGSLVEFRAPGQRVEVAWRGGGQKVVSGSSYAAALVTALLARLCSCVPGLSPLEAKALLQRSAERTT
jgi:subtilisin